ncbi:7706_t:CDS:1 [Cetraspora pellucida]|uniref:7706_t:CDS:1 n=1 Tax=Cetraspora pellucida TaxID=1433469 RepID=A0ACA9KE85_9GLOM|nr:7706_t:CDS:1 [Cetraspora pellucida]
MHATLQQHPVEISTLNHKTCPRKRFYFEDEPSHNVNKRVKTPPHLVNSFPSSTLRFSTFHSCSHDRKLLPLFQSSKIDLKENKNILEPESSSEMSRIIDLSTGESLESISNTEQQERQKLKRPLELVENDYKNSSSVESLNFEEGNFFTAMGETGVGNIYKRARTSEKPTVNYIEDVEDTELIDHTVGTIQEFKNDVITRHPIPDFSSTSKVAIDPTESLPVVVREKIPRKIEFTVQYQEAFNKYMRSQLDSVKDDEYNVRGKEMILYLRNNDEYIINDGNSDDFTADSEGKIFEIEEEIEENDIQMLDTDETNTYGTGVRLLFNEGNQSLNEDDKMDIDE